MATAKIARAHVTTALTDALTAAVNRAKQAETEAHESRREAERALMLARGTVDLQAHAAAAVRASTKRGPFYVGDHEDVETSFDAVVQCITGHGRTLWDIVEMTGIRRNRVSGFLVRAQQRRLPVKNLGNEQRAIWYLPASRRRS